MNKQEVINKMKSLNLPKGSYIVYGSAPFVIHGIREVNDIDMYVTKEIFEDLKKKGWKKVYKGLKDEPLTYDIFEAHDTWEFSPYSPTLPDLLSRATEVEGITFASLIDVKKWKQGSGRPKDIVDLKLIDDY
ncbi:MAG TPA: hypothetical protein VE090_05510, partial [Methylomirabilota bacterium]|nr:hypothetical protein [Methylomirabilota bacterium]